MTDDEFKRLLELVRTLADKPIDELRHLHGEAEESLHKTREHLRGLTRGDLIVSIIEAEFSEPM